nr:haloacid dehalogenase-like hydrolase [Frankia sp. QA3]
MPATPALILWDVDHTLLDTGGVSRQMYAQAFQAVIGRPLQELADMTGRTERAIIAETLRRNGIADPRALLPEFYAALGEAARGLQDRMRARGRRLPGAGQALAGLSGPGIVQSVVTGNLPAVAETKLAAFGLAGHLDLAVGGYGDDGDDRATLVRLAVKRAEAGYGSTFPPGRTVVIGDTPHDVKGAQDAGVRVVGVATGASSAEDLRTAGADAVLAGLTDVAALRTAVLGAAR